MISNLMLQGFRNIIESDLTDTCTVYVDINRDEAGEVGEELDAGGGYVPNEVVGTPYPAAIEEPRQTVTGTGIDGIENVQTSLIFLPHSTVVPPRSRLVYHDEYGRDTEYIAIDAGSTSRGMICKVTVRRLT